jgi:hypothetical protein
MTHATYGIHKPLQQKVREEFLIRLLLFYSSVSNCRHPEALPKDLLFLFCAFHLSFSVNTELERNA